VGVAESVNVAEVAGGVFVVAVTGGFDVSNVVVKEGVVVSGGAPQPVIIPPSPSSPAIIIRHALRRISPRYINALNIPPAATPRMMP
jgi:hypothetical protein